MRFLIFELNGLASRYAMLIEFETKIKIYFMTEEQKRCYLKPEIQLLKTRFPITNTVILDTSK